MAHNQVDIQLDISGWYAIEVPREKGGDPVEPIELSIKRKVFLDKRFVEDVRRLHVKNLRITDIRRCAGGIFNSKQVRGVKDTSDPKSPMFFIKEENVEDLSRYIRFYEVPILA
jgi:hypothetical protein